MELLCYKCQKVNPLGSQAAKVGFRDECQFCKADLHCCMNCFFYDKKVYNECKETSADVVRDKEKANFCEFFQISNRQAQISEKELLKAKAEALFKK